MKDWRRLLHGWSKDIHRTFAGNQLAWTQLGLGDPSDFSIRSPNPHRVALIQDWHEVAPPDLLDFLSVTDGWPLWLGPNSVEICRAEEFALFREKYPKVYITALSSSYGSGLVPVAGLTSVVKNSIAASRPSGRELVLFSEGKVVLFCFDYVEVFPSMYEFLSSQKVVLLGSLRDMLQG